MAPVVTALQALRGMAMVVAVTLVAEVGDLTRFGNSRDLMSHLGLVPSEHSSGATTRRSGLTKTGNAEARRVMVEAAWTYRLPARVGRILLDRLEGLPEEIRDIAWKAQVRLCARYRRLAAKGKPLPLVVAAIARELVGFAWAIARQVAAAKAALTAQSIANDNTGAAPKPPTVGGGATVRRISGHAMSRIGPTLDLRRGQLHDEPGPCGSQPAHQR
jgi:transposase